MKLTLLIIIFLVFHALTDKLYSQNAGLSSDLRNADLTEALEVSKDGHKGNNLMTIHPDGHLSSSDYFHNATWLDFNMVQSWNIKEGTEFDIISDYRRMPYKPTILAEPGYENGCCTC